MSKKIMEINTRKTGVELPEGMKKLLKTTVAERDTLMKTAAREAFEVWLLPEFGEFRDHAARHDISIPQAARMAIKAHLTGLGSMPVQPGSTIASPGATGIESVESGLSLSGEERQCVDAFLGLLRSGDQQRIKAVLGVLRGVGAKNVSTDVPKPSKTGTRKQS